MVPSKCSCLFTVHSQCHTWLPDAFSSPSGKATRPSHPSLHPSSFSTLYTPDFLEEVSSDWILLYSRGPLIRMVFYPHCLKRLALALPTAWWSRPRMEASRASDRDFRKAEASLSCLSGLCQWASLWKTSLQE